MVAQKVVISFFSGKLYTVPVRTFVITFYFGSGSKCGSGTGSDPECIPEKVLQGGVKRGYPREAGRTLSKRESSI